jgi:hypothetical protein
MNKVTITRETIIEHLLQIIKREDVKNELNKIAMPLIDILLVRIYPYLYISLLFFTISFILNIGVFIFILRNYCTSWKN